MGAWRNRGDAPSADVFRAFHRDRRRSTIWRRGPLIVVLAVAFALAGWGIASATPPGPALVPSAVSVQNIHVPPSDGTLAGPAPAGGAQPGASPAPVPLPQLAPASAPSQLTCAQEVQEEVPPQQHFSIDVTATGHQAELDAYWNDAQGRRLVTAVRVDLSLPPVMR